MPFETQVVDNDAIKGFVIEERFFEARDEDFAMLCKAVPFKPDAPPEARAWWANNAILIGSPTNCIVNMVNMRGYFVTPDNKVIEYRKYNAPKVKEKALRFCPAGRITGFECFAWWRVVPDDQPRGGAAVLCVGLRPFVVEGAEKPPLSRDGLEAKSRDELVTIAGMSGIRDIQPGEPEGQIIARIRDAKSAKKQKPVKA